MRTPNPTLFLALLCAISALSPPSYGQKSGRKKYEDHESGFLFKPLLDFETRALSSQEQATGGVLHQWCTEGIPIKTPSGNPATAHAELYVMRVKHPEAEASSTSGLRSRLGAKKAEVIGPSTLIPGLFHEGVRDFEPTALKSKEKKIGKLKARNDLYSTYFVETSTTQMDVVFDTWAFPLPKHDIVFIWRVPEQFHKKWAKAIGKSMKSFKPLLEVIEEKEHKKGSKEYEAAWREVKKECDEKIGWSLLEIPSRDWIFLSAEGDAKRVEDLQLRLEALHSLFEEDLPPKEKNRAPLKVRLMTHEEDFQNRIESADNSELTAWYDRERQELIIFTPETGESADAYLNRAATRMWFAEKMDHCEFLPWFSEGHVEYYTALKWEKKALVPTTDSLDDFDFGPLLQDIVRKGIAQPIEEHIRMQNELWLEQNDLLDERAAAVQSWAIVAFLRSGANKKTIPKWDANWAKILPGYLSTMQKAHIKAAEDARAEILAEINNFKSAGNAVPEDLIRNLRIIDIPRQTQLGLWSRAHQATFSYIDIAALESAWLKWVKTVN